MNVAHPKTDASRRARQRLRSLPIVRNGIEQQHLFSHSLLGTRNPEALTGLEHSNLHGRGTLLDNEAAPLDDCLWSHAVALDERHRPQVFNEPSGTARREWCRYPQEAHLLDEANWRYRRLTLDEIAIIQGFSPEWFDVPEVTKRNKIKAAGDAVPPPLARAVIDGISELYTFVQPTAVEICAGAGGLASGASQKFEHLLLTDAWEPACRILKHQQCWTSVVQHGDVTLCDFERFTGRVGLLSGGPPCQPWSLGGRRLGTADPRDLLGRIDTIVRAIRPEAFVFENVPGLMTDQNAEYLRDLVERLRRPSNELRYGVMAGVLNAADFGVPQIRRRVFFIGFRDAPSSLAYRAFDRIAATASHRSPEKADGSRKRWVTLEEAFYGRPDPGGWRRWIDLRN